MGLAFECTLTSPRTDSTRSHSRRRRSHLSQSGSRQAPCARARSSSAEPSGPASWLHSHSHRGGEEPLPPSCDLLCKPRSEAYSRDRPPYPRKGVRCPPAQPRTSGRPHVRGGTCQREKATRRSPWIREDERRMPRRSPQPAMAPTASRCTRARMWERGRQPSAAGNMPSAAGSGIRAPPQPSSRAAAVPAAVPAACADMQRTPSEATAAQSCTWGAIPAPSSTAVPVPS